MKVSVMKLYGHKIYYKLKVYESRYKHRAKISTEKLLISSFNNIIQFNFTSFNSEKCLSRNSFFRLETCNFTNTEPFCWYSCIIPIIQEYLQNVDFFYLLSKFLQQFQNSQNSKFSRVSSKSCFRNQFEIIANEIMYRKFAMYLRNFMALISFLFLCISSFCFCLTFTPSKKVQ